MLMNGDSFCAETNDKNKKVEERKVDNDNWV